MLGDLFYGDLDLIGYACSNEFSFQVVSNISSFVAVGTR